MREVLFVRERRREGDVSDLFSFLKWNGTELLQKCLMKLMAACNNKVIAIQLIVVALQGLLT